MLAVCDLRSDTLTRPTPGMREAMARADVGDDVYGEDPSVRALEERTAALLGKEAALFVPSGTMGNQIGLLLHTRPGDEVIVGEGAHTAFLESGAGAAWAGVQFATAGRGGLFTASEMLEAIKPRSFHYPRTSLVVVENTHNRSGGLVFPPAEVTRIAQAARESGLSLHLDGARLWNASVATGLAVDVLAAPFDTVNVCFSKGLGAPVGSAIAGTRDHVLAARRFRKMLGGGMRQAGILAAGALYALDHHRQRLAEDHRLAALLTDLLANTPGLAPRRAETNIAMLELETQGAEELAQAAAERGVLLNVTGRRQLRAVTHLDVAETQLRAGAEVLRSLVRY